MHHLTGTASGSGISCATSFAIVASVWRISAASSVTRRGYLFAVALDVEQRAQDGGAVGGVLDEAEGDLLALVPLGAWRKGLIELPNEAFARGLAWRHGRFSCLGGATAAWLTCRNGGELAG
jgi:hypothetical protein